MRRRKACVVQDAIFSNNSCNTRLISIVSKPIRIVIVVVVFVVVFGKKSR